MTVTGLFQESRNSRRCLLIGIVYDRVSVTRLQTPRTDNRLSVALRNWIRGSKRDPVRDMLRIKMLIKGSALMSTAAYLDRGFASRAIATWLPPYSAAYVKDKLNLILKNQVLRHRRNLSRVFLRDW